MTFQTKPVDLAKESTTGGSFYLELSPSHIISEKCQLAIQDNNGSLESDGQATCHRFESSEC